MVMNEKSLIKLKEDIDKAKMNLSELQGKQNYLLQELKKQFDCSTIEQAKKKAAEFETIIKNLDNTINDGLAKLEKQVNAG